MTIIRNAEERDLDSIKDIYNDAVENTLAIWNEQTVDRENRKQWWETRLSAGFPVLVAEEDGNTAGYASYGAFRPFEGYRFSAELSIYVDKMIRGKGIGKMLLAALIDHAKGNHIHMLIAGIEAGNKTSIALHEAFGFEKTGYMPEVGFKNGQWLDLVMMQKKLSKL